MVNDIWIRLQKLKPMTCHREIIKLKETQNIECWPVNLMTWKVQETSFQLDPFAQLSYERVYKVYYG